MKIQVITPSRPALDQDCRLAVLPTATGEVGVEEDHAHMMATLVPGEMRVYEEGEHGEIFAVSGGVADARPDKLLILADAVEAAGDIDIVRARQARERAEKRLEKPAGGVDIDRAEAALARAINRIRVAARTAESK